MIPLQVAAIVLVGAGGLAVVLARDLLRQALMNSFFGLQLVVLFLVFQAPDVALSALAVGVSRRYARCSAARKTSSRPSATTVPPWNPPPGVR